MGHEHRRVQLTNPVLSNTELLRDVFQASISLIGSPPRAGSGRKLTNWDDSTPTPILGNPTIPSQEASVGCPD